MSLYLYLFFLHATFSLLCMGEYAEQTNAPGNHWRSVVSDASGRRIAACVSYGGIYISSDYGESFELQTDAPHDLNTSSWESITSDASGTQANPLPLNLDSNPEPCNSNITSHNPTTLAQSPKPITLILTL